ncbi:hypothetical protein GCM10009850_001460 [Nonomuraea monospora]|uniref:Uncharacterized protein n=1 Tax=Nonomuraea monospora TaxID=568818 RepID=A0ABN3C418_9ACTN
MCRERAAEAPVGAGRGMPVRQVTVWAAADHGSPVRLMTVRAAAEQVSPARQVTVRAAAYQPSEVELRRDGDAAGVRRRAWVAEVTLGRYPARMIFQPDRRGIGWHPRPQRGFGPSTVRARWPAQTSHRSLWFTPALGKYSVLDDKSVSVPTECGAIQRLPQLEETPYA